MNKILTILVYAVCCMAKQYPLWFLEPDQLSNNTTAVFLQSVYNSKQIDTLAAANGWEQMVKGNSIRIIGSENFWSFDFGTMSTGAFYQEEYDTVKAQTIPSDIEVLDRFMLEDKSSIFLLALKADNQQDFNKLLTLSQKEPDWVTTTPENQQFRYAIGISPAYYYEKSSWQEAEKNALLNIAKNNFKIKTFFKKDQNSADEQKEIDYESTIANFKICKRWYDETNNVFYVLARCDI